MLIPPAVDSPTILSAIIAQAELAKLANFLYLEYLTAKTANTKVEYQVAEALERGLKNWRQHLPPYFTSEDVPVWFTGPRAVVLWKEQNLRILLWRGSKRNHSYLSDKVDAETRCLEVAMQTIHEITTFCATNEGILHLGIIWYATYFLFQAVLVLEASYLHRKTQHTLSDETSVWRMMVLKAQNCLSSFADKSKSSRRCLEVLDLINKRTETSYHFSGLTVPQIVGHEEERTLHIPQENSERTEQSVGPQAVDAVDHSMDTWILNDDGSDPTMRMILDNTPWGYLDNAPMDALFNEWFHPDTFDA
jgi:transcriptional regulatory protein GAL4